MPQSKQFDALRLRLEAFQVDRSWYERHWLAERPQRSLGVLSRSFTHLLRAVRATFLAGHRAGPRMVLPAPR